MSRSAVPTARDLALLIGLGATLALLLIATAVLTLRWDASPAAPGTGPEPTTRADLLASPADAQPLELLLDPQPGAAVGGGQIAGRLLTVASLTDDEGALVVIQGTLPDLGTAALAVRGPVAAGQLTVLRAERIRRDLPDGSSAYDGFDLVLAASSPVAPFDLCLWQPASGRIVAGSTQRVCLGLDGRDTP